MDYVEYSATDRLSTFMYAVYGFMASALMLTAATAFFVAQSPAVYTVLFKNPVLLFLLVLAQFALVIALSMFLPRLSFPVALLLFYVYAVALGITLSTIFIAYPMISIFKAFIATSGMFGAMCVYGYVTGTDLTKVGSIAFMGLIGIIIAMLVNLYFKSQVTDYVISIIGVVIFTALTAYDAQKIKQMGQRLLGQQEALQKVAVLGALALYLDFINLFLFMLRFMGGRRSE